MFSIWMILGGEFFPDFPIKFSVRINVDISQPSVLAQSKIRHLSRCWKEGIFLFQNLFWHMDSCQSVFSSNDGNSSCLQQLIVYYRYKCTKFLLAVHISVASRPQTLRTSWFLQKRGSVSSSRKKCCVSVKRKDLFFQCLRFPAGCICCLTHNICLFTILSSCFKKETP